MKNIPNDQTFSVSGSLKNQQTSRLMRRQGENVQSSAADLAAQLVLIADLFVNKSILSVTTPNGCTDCLSRSLGEAERAVCNYGAADFGGSL